LSLATICVNANTLGRHYSSVCFCTISEFAENGSIRDYIHVRKNKPSLEQGLVWAQETAQG